MANQAKSGWKTATQEERKKAVHDRTKKGASYINSELEQFTPIEGDNCIRIVPPLAADTMATLWGIDVWAYYLAGTAYLSPKTFDSTAHDPILAANKKYKVEDPELAKKFAGSKRTILFILNFNVDPQNPPLQIWAAPPTLIDEFVRLAKNRRTGQLYSLEDPKDGKPIFFTRTGTGINTKYTSVQIDEESYPLDESLLDQLPLFEDILVIPDETDMLAAIEDTLGGADSTESEEGSKRFSRRTESAPARTREAEPISSEKEEPEEKIEKPSQDAIASLKNRLKERMGK